MDTPYPKSGEWEAIPDCPGFFASKYGDIVNGNKQRIIRQRKAANGAMQVAINGKTRKVHDLVARAYYGQPLGEGFRAKQLNGDLTDNRPENLVWSGAAKTPPPSDDDIQLEHEYDRVKQERLDLIELMQS